MEVFASCNEAMAVLKPNLKNEGYDISIWVYEKTGYRRRFHCSKQYEPKYNILTLDESTAIYSFNVDSSSRLHTLQIKYLAFDDRNSSRVVLSSSSRTTLYRWEVYCSYESADINTINFIECETNILQPNLSLNGVADMLLSVEENGNLIVWSESLKRLRIIEPTSNNDVVNFKERCLSMVFAGNSDQYILACYDTGYLKGWNIDGASLCCFCVNSYDSSNNCDITNNAGKRNIHPIMLLPLSFPGNSRSSNRGAIILQIIVLFQDGVVKLYELFDSHGTDASHKTQRRLQQQHNTSADDSENDNSNIGNSNEDILDHANHREKAVLDLRRGMRFKVVNDKNITTRDISSSSSSAATVTRELVLLPLATCLIPPGYCLNITSNVTTKATAIISESVSYKSDRLQQRKRWDDNKSNCSSSDINYENVMNVNSGTATNCLNNDKGEMMICIVTPSCIVIIQAQTLKIVWSITLESLGIGNITTACASITVTSDINDDNNDDEEEEEGIDHSINNNNNNNNNAAVVALVHVTMRLGFEQVSKIYTIPLYRNSSSSNNNNYNNNNSRANIITSTNQAMQKLDISDKKSHKTSIANIIINNNSSSSTSPVVPQKGLYSASSSSSSTSMLATTTSTAAAVLSYFMTSTAQKEDEEGGEGENDDNMKSSSSSSLLDTTPTPSRSNKSLYATDTNNHNHKGTAVTTAKRIPSSIRSDWEAVKTSKQGKILNQPITFHMKIKSSGYGQPPPPLSSSSLIQSKLQSRAVKASRRQQQQQQHNHQTDNRGTATSIISNNVRPRSATSLGEGINKQCLYTAENKDEMGCNNSPMMMSNSKGLTLSGGIFRSSSSSSGVVAARLDSGVIINSNVTDNSSLYTDVITGDFYTEQHYNNAANNNNNNNNNSGGGGASRRLHKAAASTTGKGRGGARVRQYPIDYDGPISLHQPLNNFPPPPPPSSSSSSVHTNNNTSSSIQHISYSDDASLLGVASMDTAVLTVKLPVHKYGGEVVSYTGHGARIHRISFSHNRYSICNNSKNGRNSKVAAAALPSQYHVLSCSADGTARMWRSGHTDGASLMFSHYKNSPQNNISNNITTTVLQQQLGNNNSSAASIGGTSYSSNSSVASSTKTTTVRNRPYGDSVNYCSYFYLDKFTILTVKASVLLYQYDIDGPDKQNDLKRTLAQGEYKRRHMWEFSNQAHNITAMACINSVMSPLIFCATSDKCISILDGHTGTIARQLDSNHSRAVHCIALPKPTIHVPIGPDAYNMFLTAAMDNVISLWDIRDPVCVARYSSHVNRREPITCDISPCLRYIATGSEDKTARIYDIRTGKELAKLGGGGLHRDVVSSVAFNPLFPQLATASYDGTVKFFIDPLCNASVQPGL